MSGSRWNGTAVFFWRQLDRPIQIVVIIIAVLGFGLAGYSTGHTMTGYVAGMLVGGAIGFLVSYFVIYKKRSMCKRGGPE